MTLIVPVFDRERDRTSVESDPSAWVETLMQEYERLSTENASLKAENERWGKRIKFLEAKLAEIRNLVR